MSPYIVKPGDSLSKVAAQYGVDYKQITGYKSGNPNLIYAGETLNIPDKAGSASAITVPSPTYTPNPTYQTTGNTGVPNSAPTTAGSGSYDTNALVSALVSKGYNQVDAQNAATGPRASELAKEYLGVGGSTGGSAGSVGAGGIGTSFNQPTLDLPGLYNGLYKSSGITDLESQLTQKTKDFNSAYSTINNNPYLSEGSRNGRVAKLQQDFNNDTAGVRNDIATKKADIETQLSIQTKQFDINNQQAQQARQQFNDLLQSGALAGASGDDIAAITRATGISSSMIRSAVDAQTAKNVTTQTIQFDDGVNQGFAIINNKTGDIISKQVVAKSTPTAAQRNASSGTGTATSSTKNIQQEFLDTTKTIKGMQTDAGWVGQFPLLVAQYAPFMSLQDIYKLYAQSDLGKQYGTPNEPAGDIKQIYDNYRGKS